MVVDDGGNIYFTDEGNSKVRKITVGASTTGVKSQNSPKVVLYPNPATDNVSLISNDFKGDNVAISLIDMSGKIIETRHFDQTGAVTFNVAQLSSGEYFLRVDGNDGINYGYKFTKK